MVKVFDVVLVVWNEIPVGLQQVRTIAHRRQVLDLLPKDLTRFDRPSSTEQSQGPCQRWSRPLARANIEIFLAMKEQTGLWWALECLGAWINQRETVL